MCVLNQSTHKKKLSVDQVVRRFFLKEAGEADGDVSKYNGGLRST